MEGEEETKEETILKEATAEANGAEQEREEGQMIRRRTMAATR